MGITKFCEQLIHFRSTKKIVGGTKKVHLDRIIYLQPDIIIANKDENAFEIGRYSHHAKVMFVDGAMFSWYGTRLYKAFQYFSELQKWF